MSSCSVACDVTRESRTNPEGNPRLLQRLREGWGYNSSLGWAQKFSCFSFKVQISIQVSSRRKEKRKGCVWGEWWVGKQDMRSVLLNWNWNWPFEKWLGELFSLLLKSCEILLMVALLLSMSALFSTLPVSSCWLQLSSGPPWSAQAWAYLLAQGLSALLTDSVSVSQATLFYFILF